MLNTISIMGRIARDPELRYTQSEKAVATFCVACERDFADKTGNRPADFIDCVAWTATGEFISSHFHKGDMIAVTGRLQKRSWEDKDGNKRTAAEVIVERAYFCGGKAKQETEGFEDLPDDDGELPF